jgi:hypothetical protein
LFESHPDTRNKGLKKTLENAMFFDYRIGALGLQKAKTRHNGVNFLL